MQVDVLIIGQGISGTMLSWFLHKEGKSFVVIDDNRPDAPTHVAAGLINPVTGRRYVYTWMIDTLMSFAEDTYTAMGHALDVKAVFKKSVIDFFPTVQGRDAFIKRLTEDDTYLHSYPDQNHFNQYFNYDFGCGEIRPAYSVNISLLAAAWRKKLFENNSILNETFDAAELKIKDDIVEYRNITAQKIIFCDGIAAAESPWFNLLPFAANKGEALIIECKELTNEHIFKKGLSLVPLSVENTFWVGSNYSWNFTDVHPTTEFYQQATTQLKSWLKPDFKVLTHKASVRPATLERRPFVGFHPVYTNVGILNGMGTKGTSLAPFFASQLVQHIVYGFPIAPEADVHRFKRILSK